MKMAFDSIAGHKFRSALTILGIVVGIITAVVVASILTGMRQSIVSIVEEYGTNNIYVFHLSMGGGGNNRDERNRKPLTDADADAIMHQSTTIDDIALINPGIGNFGPSFDDNLKYEGRNYRWANVDGVSSNYDRILNLGIKEGRWLTEADNLQRRNVLVIGVSCREALFPNPDESPIGKVVRMNGDTWEVVGVVEKRKSGFFGENEEDQKVFMPYRTSRKAAPLRDFTLFIIQGKPDQLNDTVADAGASPLEFAIDVENRRRYDDALTRLAPLDREAIVGRLELGYSYEQLALVLKKPTPGAARVAVRRALIRLSDEMRCDR